MFIFDLFITFISAFERKDGVLEVRPIRIVKHNLTLNNFTDIVSAFPFFTLARLLNIRYTVTILAIRLLKIIKMMRVLSKIPIVKYLKYSRLNWIARWISDHNLRMIQSFVIAIFSVHVAGCFWFLSSRFDDFNPKTWVYRKGLVDNTPFWQYSNSMYWAIQTLVTVGYGDYPARTYPELIMCLVWMAFGVNFYSFLVGSITSHVTSESAN